MVMANPLPFFLWGERHEENQQDNWKRLLNKKSTGENIRKLILTSNFSYEDIAEFLQLNSPRVIYEWVNGEKMPSLENFINLALIFNVKLESIIEFL